MDKKAPQMRGQLPAKKCDVIGLWEIQEQGLSGVADHPGHKV